LFDHVYSGPTRESWVRMVLSELNEEGSPDSPLPSPGMKIVIERLMWPSSFFREGADRNTAYELMNGILERYGLRVDIGNGETWGGHASLSATREHWIATAVSPRPARSTTWTGVGLSVSRRSRSA
jgi:hypothetical protein